MGVSMSKSKNSSAEYTRVYEGLRGVDFSIVPSRDSHTRFSYLENMYVDYDGADTAVESVVGFRTLVQLGAKINGIFLHKIDDYDQLVIVHAGTNLYMFDSNARDSITKITPVYTAMKNTRSRAYGRGKWWGYPYVGNDYLDGRCSNRADKRRGDCRV